jgi:hypothetical protein
LSCNAAFSSGVTIVTVTAQDVCGNEADPLVITVTVGECDEACSPGFWKQPHHYIHWCTAGYQPVNDFCGPGPATTFAAAFGVPPAQLVAKGLPADLLLSTAIAMSGGALNQTLFHGSAALLSAAHPAVGFPASVAQVQLVMQNAFSGVISFGQARNTFSGWNAVEGQGGCPLSNSPAIADLNFDGIVDGDDLQVLLDHWGQHDGAVIGDLNGDLIVDEADVLILMSYWGL